MPLGQELPVGAVVRLCLGGVFSGDLHIRNTWPCTEASPCALTSYSTPTQPDTPPSIAGSVFIDGDPAEDRGGYLEIRGVHVNPIEQAPAIAIARGTRAVTLADLETTGPGVGIAVGDPRWARCGPMECPKPENIAIEDSLIMNTALKAFGSTVTEYVSTVTAYKNNGLASGRPQVYVECIDGEPCRMHDVRNNALLIENRFDLEDCRAPQIRIDGETVGAVFWTTAWIFKAMPRLAVPVSSFRGPRTDPFSRCRGKSEHRTQSRDYALAVSSCVDCIMENNVISMNRNTFGITINAPVRRGASDHAFLDGLSVRHNSHCNRAPRARHFHCHQGVRQWSGPSTDGECHRELEFWSNNVLLLTRLETSPFTTNLTPMFAFCLTTMHSRIGRSVFAA